MESCAERLDNLGKETKTLIVQRKLYYTVSCYESFIKEEQLQ